MNLQELLKIVIDRNASDLHLCTGLPPIIRINNKLEKLGDKPLSSEDISKEIPQIISDRKIDLQAWEEIDFSMEFQDVARFRVNVYRDTKGACLAFRYIPNRIKTFEELGLPKSIEPVCHLHRGLVVVTGITGSGKSTTLASIIDRITKERNDHIITIEDPIEFIYANNNCVVNQREIGTHTPSFSCALRAALREDPDIILVGELRDLDTISMAITAAETGHLVLATLHTRGAAQTIDRMIDVFPPHQQEQIRTQLADVLEMIVSQVLVPSHDGKTRHLASEIMRITPAIKHLIREKKAFQIKNEIETGKLEGMHTLDNSLQELVNAGKISLELALPWVSDKKQFSIYNQIH